MTALFVTFEGLDGSGKSTHLEEAFRWLESKGIACQVAQEPGGTPSGEAIREIFLDPRWGEIDGTVEALLVFASRREHLLEVIEPALAEGRNVICDRFTDSTFAYQGYGRGVPLSILREVARLATGGRVPARTLLFDLHKFIIKNHRCFRVSELRFFLLTFSAEIVRVNTVSNIIKPFRWNR
jgi:dTMP kinase